MKLKKLFEYYEQILLEQNYNNMFHEDYDKLRDIFVFRGNRGIRPRKNDTWKWHVEEAKRILKKNHRIIWYLKWTKAYFLFELASKMSTAGIASAWGDYAEEFNIELNKNALKEEQKKLYKRINKDLGRLKMRVKLDTNNVSTYISQHPERILTGIEHFLNYNIPKINDMEFDGKTPQNLYNEMQAIQQEWSEKRKQYIPYEEGKQDKVFLKIDNEYTWFDLQSHKCSRESMVTGHCGTSSRGSSDTLLSLRKLITIDGEKYFDSVLTFAIDKRTGDLGEMKGKKNSKPKKEYHPQIFKLLMDDRVQGISGNGYRPETNFAISDLPQDKQDYIFEKKPQLTDINDYYERYGVDKTIKLYGKDKFIREIGLEQFYADEGWDKTVKIFGEEAILNDEDLGVAIYVKHKGFDQRIIKGLKEAGVEFINNNKQVVITNHTSLADFVEDYGDRNEEWMMEVFTGNEYIDTDYIEFDENTFSYHLTNADEEALDNYAANKYPDEYELNDENWYQTLDQMGDDVVDGDEGLKRLFDNATRFGIESQIMKAFKDAYEEGMKTHRGDYIFQMKPDFGAISWDNDPVLVVTDIEHAISEIKDEGDTMFFEVADFISEAFQYTPKFEVEVPYYGWDGFDEKLFEDGVKLLIQELK